MSPQTIRIVVAVALLLHGLAHGRAFFALVADATRSGSPSSIPVRSWLIPSLAPKASAIVASVFWFLSTIGFLAAAASLWGTPVPKEAWRELAVAASVVSSLGIGLFSGTWPGAPNRKLSTLDTVIALVMNAAILTILPRLGWPAQHTLG